MRRAKKGWVKVLPPFASPPPPLILPWLPVRKCTWSINSPWNKERPSQIPTFLKRYLEKSSTVPISMARFQAPGRLGWEKFGYCGENFQSHFESLLSPSRFLHCLVSLLSANCLMSRWVNACPHWKLDSIRSPVDSWFSHNVQQSRCFWPQSFQPDCVRCHILCLLAGFMRWHCSNRECRKRLQRKELLQSLSHHSENRICQGLEDVWQSTLKEGRVKGDTQLCKHSAENVVSVIRWAFSSS